MAKKINKQIDNSTEEKIKEAARKLFTKKGFAAVKTRDIAEEAGINLALLNYYFRSKEKLFDIIMAEAMQQFIQGVALIFNDEKTSVDQKLEGVVENYIDMLTHYPDLPFFVLNEIRTHPEKMAAKMEAIIQPARSTFFKQIHEMMIAKKKEPIHTLHLMANMMGLIVFPFIGAPLLKKINNVNDKQFIELMRERKKLIPIWIKGMIMAM
ncbi:MAG: TetR/AcrR family transcriptional regulator [Bacteroidetes bacterium]|nr:TetR/AcrR family transcriptional regulator [Bacteroidota bacterium]